MFMPSMSRVKPTTKGPRSMARKGGDLFGQLQKVAVAPVTELQGAERGGAMAIQSFPKSKEWERLAFPNTR
jgi:hypothetical protein